MEKQQKKADVKLPKGPESGKLKVPPYQGHPHVIFDSPREPDVVDGDKTRREIYQLPDEELPGIVLIVDLLKLDIPSFANGADPDQSASEEAN